MNNHYFVDPNPSKLSSKQISEGIIAYRKLHKHPRLCIGISRTEYDKLVSKCEACKKEGRRPTNWIPPKTKAKTKKRK